VKADGHASAAPSPSPSPASEARQRVGAALGEHDRRMFVGTAGIVGMIEASMT